MVAIYDSKSKENIVCSAADEGDSKIAPQQEIKLSWECESEKEKLYNIPEEPDLELTPVGAINDRFSWCSKDSDLFTYTAKSKSERIFAAPSLPLGEGDNMPRHQLMDNGVPDGMPVLHCPGQMRDISQKQSPSFMESSSPYSSSNSSGSVLQDDPVTEDVNIVRNDHALLAQRQFLLDSFSSLCLKDDPEKSISILHRLRYKSKWARMRRRRP
jgi:hypothetical protein